MKKISLLLVGLLAGQQLIFAACDMTQKSKMYESAAGTCSTDSDCAVGRRCSANGICQYCAEFPEFADSEELPGA